MVTPQWPVPSAMAHTHSMALILPAYLDAVVATSRLGDSQTDLLGIGAFLVTLGALAVAGGSLIVAHRTLKTTETERASGLRQALYDAQVAANRTPATTHRPIDGCSSRNRIPGSASLLPGCRSAASNPQCPVIRVSGDIYER